MARVSLQQIGRRYGNVTAIADITFEIPDGEFWVLVGPSGCGKSTVLRTIAGLERATSGQLYIGDTLVNDIPARQRDVAMVFQNYALYPHMSVAENIAFGMKMRQESPDKIERRLQEVARGLNIEHLLRRKPKQLSGGQQQRVALGRAIARNPKVFLLDEPLSNLDAQLRDDTRAELKQLHQRVGITTVYVTHDQVEAMTLGDRIVVLKDGRIQQIDTPQQVYARPANSMVASFLGSPPMNILSLSNNGTDFFLHNQLIDQPTKIKQQLIARDIKDFDLGIRPEAIQLTSDLETDLNHCLKTKLVAIEPLGKEILLRTQLVESTASLDLFAPPNWRGNITDILSVKLNPEHIFIFASTTGETIYHAKFQ